MAQRRTGRRRGSQGFSRALYEELSAADDASSTLEAGGGTGVDGLEALTSSDAISSLSMFTRLVDTLSEPARPLTQRHRANTTTRAEPQPVDKDSREG